ncbi:MAG: hypothetical protein ACI4U2_02295 [Christensenellaceae bacterium]
MIDKRTCGIVAIALMLTQLLPTQGIVAVADEVIDHEEYADYIENNTAEFSAAFGVMEDGETPVLNATSVEYRCLVWNTIKGEYNTYLDFDGDNGYILLGNGKWMYDFAPQGDLDYLRSYSGTIFFEESGYCYQEGNTYHNFVQTDVPDYVATTTYTGTQSRITSTDALEDYLRDKYSTFFTRTYNYIYLDMTYQERLLGDFNRISRSYTSVMLNNGYTEGNCTIFALWHQLNYYATHFGKTNLCPYSSTSDLTWIRTYEEDDAYCSLQYGTQLSDKTLAYRDQINELIKAEDDLGREGFKLPILYSSIRDYAVARGYIVMNECGFGTEEIATCARSILSSKGYSNSGVTAYMNGYTLSNVKNAINSYYPVYYSVGNDITYGSHAMVITGYRVYEIKYSTGNMYGSKYIVTVNIADGTSNDWSDVPSLSNDTNLPEYSRNDGSSIMIIGAC